AAHLHGLAGRGLARRRPRAAPAGPADPRRRRPRHARPDPARAARALHGRAGQRPPRGRRRPGLPRGGRGPAGRPARQGEGRFEVSAAPRWALVPVVLLVLCVGGQVLLITASSAAPGLSVEPHYYEKAQGWDERQAQERRAADLGWRVDVEVVPGEVRV